MSTTPRPLTLYAVSALITAAVFAGLAAAAGGEWWILPVALVVHLLGFLVYIQVFVRRLGSPPGQEAPGRPDREGAPDSAESGRAEELSERVPEPLSGEGATPLGSTDQHSDAPGPHGLGDRVARPPGS